MSFRQFIRLVFVIFSLYLLGDAFYRWDGFRYHSTFIEFIPSVALVSILWSIVALLASILVWLLLKSIEWACHRIGLRITIAHLLVYLSVVMISGVLVWQGKRLLFADLHTTYQTKLAAFISVSLISLIVTWLVRNSAGNWITAIHDRITPLVWLFGMLVLISVPIVAYHTWFKDTGNVISQKAQPQVTDQKRPNIILVTFDALSAREMSTYGYHRPTTPFITEWAKEATLFTNLKAESNWTTSTTASLMTGKKLWTHRAAHLQGSLPIKSDTESLPLLLKKNGYFNMAFVANKLATVDKLGIANSFDSVPPFQEFITIHSIFGEMGIVDVLLYRLFAKKIRLYNWIVSDDFMLYKLQNKLSLNVAQITSPPSKVFNSFLEGLKNNPPEPFFSWIHIYPPHDPYLPPDPYIGFYNSTSEFRTSRSQEDVRLESIKYLHQFQPFPQEMQPSIDILRSRYDESVRYCDKEFEDFIKQLMMTNQIKNTVVILSADHGESFENGYFQHAGPFLYEAVTHIPLIIKKSKQNEQQIVHQLISQVDIPATILDLAGIPVPSWMEGRTLMPLLEGKSLTPRPAFSMWLGKNSNQDLKITKGSYAVWEDDYKLIHYLEQGKSLLFNLRQDAGELNNIFEKEPKTGQHLLDLIYENLKQANDKINREMVIVNPGEKK